MPTTLLFHGDVAGSHPCAEVNRHLMKGLALRGYDLHLAAPHDPHPLGLSAPPDVYLQHAIHYDWRIAPGNRNLFILHRPLSHLLTEEPRLQARLDNYYQAVVSPCPLADDRLKVPVVTVPWGVDVNSVPVAERSTETLTVLLLGPPGAAREAFMAAWQQAFPPPVDWSLVATEDPTAAGDLAIATADDLSLLSTLKCLASGRPVLVPWAVPDLPFAIPYGADSWPAQLLELSRALPARPTVRQSVVHRSWEHALDLLDRVIRGPARRSSPGRPVQVAYAFLEKGTTSWRKYSTHLESCLRSNLRDFAACPATRPFNPNVRGLLLGQSEYALESFVAARRVNPDVHCVLHQEGSVLRLRDGITNDERERCGMPRQDKPSLEYWRNDQELALARHLIVSSEPARRHLLRAGHAAAKIRLLPFGIDVAPRLLRRTRDRLRFLFVGTDPFRKGVRLLFEAWNILQPRNAELVCVASNRLLESELLVRLIVRNPSIVLQGIESPRRFQALYPRIDCQILPSLEDSFSLATAEGMGMGKPAIVSDETGIQDIITHGVDGYVVPTGSVSALVEAIGMWCDNPSLVERMGEASYETARQHGWSRFDQRLLELMAELGVA